MKRLFVLCPVLITVIGIVVLLPSMHGSSRK